MYTQTHAQAHAHAQRKHTHYTNKHTALVLACTQLNIHNVCSKQQTKLTAKASKALAKAQYYALQIYSNCYTVLRANYYAQYCNCNIAQQAHTTHTAQQFVKLCSKVAQQQVITL